MVKKTSDIGVMPNIATKFAKITAETAADITGAQASEGMIVPVGEMGETEMIAEMCFKIAPETKDLPLDQRVYVCMQKAHVSGYMRAAGIQPIFDEENGERPIGFLSPENGFYTHRDIVIKMANEARESGIVYGQTHKPDGEIKGIKILYPWRERCVEWLIGIMLIFGIRFVLMHFGVIH